MKKGRKKTLYSNEQEIQMEQKQHYQKKVN